MREILAPSNMHHIPPHAVVHKLHTAHVCDAMLLLTHVWKLMYIIETEGQAEVDVPKERDSQDKSAEAEQEEQTQVMSYPDTEGVLLRYISYRIHRYQNNMRKKYVGKVLETR